MESEFSTFRVVSTIFFGGWAVTAIPQIDRIIMLNDLVASCGTQSCTQIPMTFMVLHFKHKHYVGLCEAREGIATNQKNICSYKLEP